MDSTEPELEPEPDVDPDPRVLTQTAAGIRYVSPLRFDDVPPEHFACITSIPWLTISAVDENSESDFNQESAYVCDVQLYWGVVAQDLSSRL